MFFTGAEKYGQDSLSEPPLLRSASITRRENLADGAAMPSLSSRLPLSSRRTAERASARPSCTSSTASRQKRPEGEAGRSASSTRKRKAAVFAPVPALLRPSVSVVDTSADSFEEEELVE